MAYIDGQLTAHPYDRDKGLLIEKNREMIILPDSERLQFRRFTMNDAPLIFDLNSDPEVTMFTHDPITKPEEANRILRDVIIPQYEQYGYGRWAVHAKEDGRFIGYCGLKYRKERAETDLGYRFLRSEWGKGYATEAALACIRTAFEQLHLDRIVARADVRNTPSLNVLEKCGLKKIGFDTVDGSLVKSYELLAEDFPFHQPQSPLYRSSI